MLEIVLLAMVAAFLGLRLYSVLGRRAEQEEEPVPQRFESDDKVAGIRPAAMPAPVVAPRPVELEGVMPAVERALRSYEGTVAVMSFDPRVPKWFADHAPGVVRGLVVTEENDRGMAGRLRRRLAFRHARPHFLAYDVRDLPSAFAAAHRARGVPLLTWTVRSPDLRARAAARQAALRRLDGGVIGG